MADENETTPRLYNWRPDKRSAMPPQPLALESERRHAVVLLGTEGQAAALYFSQFPRMIKLPVPTKSGSTGFEFHSRNRRPPRDPVNALLSFG